jgi:murein L,D-transpeptidase YafK
MMRQNIVLQNILSGRKALLKLMFVGITLSASYVVLTRLGFIPSLSELPEILCLSGCPAEQPLHALNQNASLLNNPQEVIQRLKNPIARSKISILIEKSKYKLTVFYDAQPIKSYPIVLGGNPQGDKFAEGDLKTPEGIYQIRDLYPHSDWSKFLWLNYPTSQSWREHFHAKITGKLNWLLPIGSEVGIHGVPRGGNGLIEQRSNWTWGCVSLKNEDIDEIYQVVEVGTWVEIVP